MSESRTSIMESQYCGFRKHQLGKYGEATSIEDIYMVIAKKLNPDFTISTKVCEKCYLVVKKTVQSRLANSLSKVPTVTTDIFDEMILQTPKNPKLRRIVKETEQTIQRENSTNVTSLLLSPILMNTAETTKVFNTTVISASVSEEDLSSNIRYCGFRQHKLGKYGDATLVEEIYMGIAKKLNPDFTISTKVCKECYMVMKKTVQLRFCKNQTKVPPVLSTFSDVFDEMILKTPKNPALRRIVKHTRQTVQSENSTNITSLLLSPILPGTEHTIKVPDRKEPSLNSLEHNMSR